MVLLSARYVMSYAYLYLLRGVYAHKNAGPILLASLSMGSCFGWVKVAEASNCKPNTGHSIASADASDIEIGWLDRRVMADCGR